MPSATAPNLDANRVTATAAVSPVQPADEGTAAALALLRERLPPIQPPVTQPFKRRPPPSSLAASLAPKKAAGEGGKGSSSSAKSWSDYDKDLIRMDLKSQAQPRAALEALEQHNWTRLLLDHLHALTALEENVLYREAGGRENLQREEDRNFMLLFVEFEARLQRIRGRELVGIQLKKHLLAIEQQDVRNAIEAEELAGFRQVLHKEVIYRPASVAEDGTPLAPSRGGRSHASTTRSQRSGHSSVGRSPQRSSLEVRKPVPPLTRPVNSARTEDRFVTNGRTMWGTQKEIRHLQSLADAAAASLPPTEQLQRESIEGSELEGRLCLERMLFEESFVAVRREALRLVQDAEEQKLLQSAHEQIATGAVDIVMDRVISHTAGCLPDESYAVKEASRSVERSNDSNLLNKPSTSKRQTSVDTTTCTPTDEELKKPSPQQPALRSRSNSLTRLTTAPTERLESQRFISACVEAVEAETACREERSVHTNGAAHGALLTPMEIITIVDEVHQKLFPCVTEDEWKTSGIGALREAAAVGGTTVVAEAASNTTAAAEVPPSTTAADAVTDPTPPKDTERPSSGKQRSPPPSPPRPLLFPGLDLLCDVMLDCDSIDAFTPWKMFLSAVMEVEINDATAAASAATSGGHDPAPFVRRLYEGHRNAMLSRDYLENVLWRVSHMHHGVVNALELIPTRWTSYTNPKELEEEEKSEVVWAEVIAREKLILDQINEFCNVLHYSHVRKQIVNSTGQY